ncbi:hypothetical protein Taro_033110 [Colocasia esculenta]|uniref:Uncharacterized protein n=1 Tax=Colocasia esculenta TaxID=4460 RepID=A0A843W5Y9_COLES|nr:hypothetical protein [Colocasia esculenta]
MASSVLAPTKFLFFLLSPPQLSSSFAAATIDNSRHNLLHLLRSCLLAVLHTLLFLLRLASLSVPRALSRALNPNPTPPFHHDSNGCLHTPAPGGAVGLGEDGSTYVARALSDVLEVVTRIPVSSRKYELARGLADRLLDENVRCGSPALAAVNRAALAAAFSRTLRNLEAAVRRARGSGKADGSVERILGGVRSRLRWWAEPAEEEEGEAEGWTASGGDTAEKLAAEALWLAEKMAACGAVGEAVVRWGAVAGLGQLALASEPRLQGTFVRISGTMTLTMVY